MKKQWGLSGLIGVASLCVVYSCVASNAIAEENIHRGEFLAFNWNIFHKAPPQPTSGSISGRALTIGNGGGLMPARRARIYLIKNYGGKQSLASLTNQKFQSKDFNYSDYLTEDVAKYGGSLSYNVFAQMVVAQNGSSYAPGKLYYSVYASVKEIQELDNSRLCIGRQNEATTDIDGNFAYVRIPFGNYTLVLVGRAGDHDRVWQKNISLNANNSSVRIELSDAYADNDALKYADE